MNPLTQCTEVQQGRTPQQGRAATFIAGDVANDVRAQQADAPDNLEPVPFSAQAQHPAGQVGSVGIQSLH